MFFYMFFHRHGISVTGVHQLVVKFNTGARWLGVYSQQKPPENENTYRAIWKLRSVLLVAKSPILSHFDLGILKFKLIPHGMAMSMRWVVYITTSVSSQN